MRMRPVVKIWNRRKRGLTMLNSILLLALVSLTWALSVDGIAGYVHSLAVQSEARSLSHLADAGRQHAARDATGILQRIRAAADSHLLLTAAELSATGALAPGDELRSSRGRTVSIAAASASADPADERVVLLAWTDIPAATDRIALPRAGAGISGVGRVGSGIGIDGCRLNHICGSGLDWNAAAIIGLLVPGPERGAMAALRLVHLAADRDPYLHRTDVGAPLANRVVGDFDMRGQELRGTGAADWEITMLQAEGSVSATAWAEFGNVVISDRTSVAGGISAGTVVAAETTQGAEEVRPNLVSAGSATAERLSMTGSIGAAEWAGAGASSFAAEGMSISGRLTLADRLRVENSWPPGSPLPVAAPRLLTLRADVSRSLNAVATGDWGTGELVFEIADVESEAMMGGSLQLDAGGIGSLELLDTPGCTGC